MWENLKMLEVLLICKIRRTPPYQSGKFEALNRHISKRGNKHLGKTGYEVMKSIKSSCKSDNELKAYIIKKENEGKSKKSAKVVNMLT